jgi:hypothetical protein
MISAAPPPMAAMTNPVFDFPRRFADLDRGA